MKNNILMFSIFGVVIIYMCMSGIKVYAAEETNSITDGSYTVTIPREVQIPSGSTSQSFDVTCNKIYKDDVVNVTVDKKNGSMKSKGGTASIPYDISFGDNTQNSNEMTFTPDKTINSISVNLNGEGKVAGTYSDTLTFKISSQKQQYNLNIRGYLEDNPKENIAEIADITVSGITDSTSNSLQYTNVDSTTKYRIQVVIKEPSKYVLSEVKSNGKTGDSTGFTWDKNSNTITGTVAGDYATNGKVYVDLHFVPKTYTLTFDAYEGTFKDGSKQKTYEVQYDKPLSMINDKQLMLSEHEPYYFGGWYVTKGEHGFPKKSSDKMPNQNLTLYAGFSNKVMVGLNGLLKGETELRGTLEGLGTADFIITKGPSKDIQAKSLYEVTDIIDDYFSEDEYQLKIHPNNGYRFLQLSTDPFHHSNADMSGTGNLQGRLYDQPISLIDGSRFVSFNVMFEPMQWGMDFTVSDCAKPSFKIGRKNNYTFNQSYLLPTIPPDQLKEGCTSFKWKVMTHEQTFYFEPGEDINNNDSFKNYIAVISKDSTSTPVSTLYFTAEPINSSSLAVLENEMDDSTSDLTTYSNVNDENSVCLQSNFNTISQPELGTEENKESEENTDGE